jgi:hypothetical protein
MMTEMRPLRSNEAIEAGIRPLRPNEAVEAVEGDKAIEAVRGRGGRDKAIEAETRPLRSNEALEAGIRSLRPYVAVEAGIRP